MEWTAKTRWNDEDGFTVEETYLMLGKVDTSIVNKRFGLILDKGGWVYIVNRNTLLLSARCTMEGVRFIVPTKSAPEYITKEEAKDRIRAILQEFI